MKKLFSVLAVLAVMGTANLFAIGIGAQGGYPLGGALTAKLDEFPCIFAVDARLGSTTGFGITADWWIDNPKIDGTWGYFYGVGVGGDLYFGSGWSTLSVGPRVIAGTNIFVLDKFLELYLQAAYMPTFNIIISGDSGDGGFDWTGFGISGGFRIWLD